MIVTKSIHAIEIPFKVTIAPEMHVDRLVFAYLIFGDRITLIDSGVAGTESVIFDYIRKNDRDPREISMLILSHAHPDHIGSAQIIKKTTHCKVLCHPAEKDWVEHIERQARERPVPGFNSLVAGSIPVDDLLQDGDLLNITGSTPCKVIHTPGHSAGSVSLFFENEEALFSADALPVPGDLPVYDDIAASVASIKKLKSLEGIKILLSSWEPPIYGKDQIKQRMASSIAYLHKIHSTVLSAHEKSSQTGMPLCKQVVAQLGLPPFVANSLVAEAFASSLEADISPNLFDH